MYSIQKWGQNSFPQTSKDLSSARTRFKWCRHRGGQRATGGSHSEADVSVVLRVNVQQVNPHHLKRSHCSRVPVLLHVTSRMQALLVSVALTLLMVVLPSSLEVLCDNGVMEASFRAVTRLLHRELSPLLDLSSPLKPRRNCCPGWATNLIQLCSTQLSSTGCHVLA